MKNDQWIKPQTLKAVQKLVTSHCANSHSGNQCFFAKTCFYYREMAEGQQIDRCKYFAESVLPSDPALETEYHHQLDQYLGGSSNTAAADVAKCARCRKPFHKNSNAHRFCDQCKEDAKKDATKLRQKRFRQRSRQG